ncbi:hypothetical protein EDB81DRAFT_183046 [Dactylonectria macrodidyma]|uniref:Uncharacterized protein n=1 Tax=Dactylonectria macrodidyma TaxID=307937 RepID=A0A9P9JPN5_9HYPO|nr:hypothetical protein EDB81DRAFT_183046 [Dactylonectria macrodidyma]
MSAIASYSFGNLAWLGTQALPLIIWPSFIGSILRAEDEVTSPLEAYFARSLGFALLALGLVVVVLSGAVPLTSAANGSILPHSSSHLLMLAFTLTRPPSPTASSEEVSPYASATILISTFHHASAAFYCYGRYTWTGESGYLFGCMGSAIFASFGLYCVMFAGDTAMVSRYHKFDQSTSGFPFKNTQSYRSKKKAL